MALRNAFADLALDASLQTVIARLNSVIAQLGEVSASPTENTIADRLRDLLSELQLKPDLTETALVDVVDRANRLLGTVSLDAAALAALENITVTAVDFDMRNLVFATDKVDTSGSQVSLTPANITSLTPQTNALTDAQLRASSIPVLDTAVRDRLPSALDADGGIKVHVQNPGSGGGGGGLTNTELRATPVPVSGFETGLATETTLVSARDRLPPTLDADGGFKVHVQNPGIGGGGLTDAELRASPVAVDLSASSLAALETINVVGPLTNAQLRATAVAIDAPDLTFATDKVDVTGSQVSLTPANITSLTPQTNALTDAQLRASSLPLPVDASTETTLAQTRDRLPTALDVDGGIKVHVQNPGGGGGGGLTDTELRATPVPITGTVNQGTAGAQQWSVKDDFIDFYADHRELVPNQDTTITFPSQVRLVKVINWDISNRILVKNGAIATNADATASRVGKAPGTDIPNDSYFPFRTTTINVRSASASEVTIEGYP